MSTNLESSNYEDPQVTQSKPSNWLKIALFTAGSAFAGGMAAAWWYRKTLTKLRESGETAKNSHFGISGSSPSEGTDDEI